MFNYHNYLFDYDNSLNGLNITENSNALKALNKCK